MMDPLGHHALTCKHGGDVVSRHNRLRDVLLESCRLACLDPQVEAGSGLGHEGHSIGEYKKNIDVTQLEGISKSLNFSSLGIKY